MADVTRVNGDANGVVNMDIGLNGDTSVGVIIATGLTKHPTAYKITSTSLDTEMGAGGKVERILRKLGVAATIVMYQVDTGGLQLNVLVEATGFVNDAAVLTALGADASAVSSAAGFSLA
jgi:hypothetical protein